MEIDMKRVLANWRIHLLAFVLTVIAEMIGTMRFDFGIVAFAIFPMFYALIFGAVLGGIKLIPREMMEKASPYGGICVMMVVAKCGTGIGPNLEIVKSAGIAMILQELGSIFTVILALPIAVLVFRMGRAAIGCSFFDFQGRGHCHHWKQVWAGFPGRRWSYGRICDRNNFRNLVCGHCHIFARIP